MIFCVHVEALFRPKQKTSCLFSLGLVYLRYVSQEDLLVDSRQYFPQYYLKNMNNDDKLYHPSYR